MTDGFDILGECEAEDESGEGAKDADTGTGEKNTRIIMPRVAPMVRRMAMSFPLSFTNMMRLEMMLKAATTIDKGQNQEHDVPLHLDGIEET